jgi:peptidoglycan-N-acetylglucosamine deacetylase
MNWIFAALLLQGMLALRAPNTCVNKGQVALVFSDGPVPYSDEIVTVLAEEGITATFMFSVMNLDHSGVVERIKNAVDNGHTVGLRTHPEYQFNEMSESEIEDAIRMEVDTLKGITGQDVKYISINQDDAADQTVLGVIDGMGLVLVSYNYDMYGMDEDGDDMLKRWETKLNSIRPASISYIVLQHDQREEELGILPNVIGSAAQAGFTFVNMDDCLSGATMEGDSASGSTAGPRKKSSAAAPSFVILCLLPLLLL